MFGAGYFSKAYFGGGYFGPAPIFDNGPPTYKTNKQLKEEETLEAERQLLENREAVDKLEILRNLRQSPKVIPIDDRISQGLLEEKLKKPVKLEPDIALMIAMLEASED